MRLPNAEFWRIWSVAACLTAAFCSAFFYAAPVRAEKAIASFYGAESGHYTASGARFAPLGLSSAHRTWPFGTRVRFTFRGRSAVCPVNDRGPATWTGRQHDLSRGCARAIGLKPYGVGQVRVERLN